MTKCKVPQNDGDELHRLAEKRLGENAGKVSHPVAEEDPLSLHHKLQVHQIELEMQNEELRKVREELETSLGNYTDLYDFAPVGYVAIDRKGTIRTVNLTGASLLGTERSRIIGRRFERFLSYETRVAFADFIDKVFRSPAKETCEVLLLKDGEPEIFQIEGVAVPSGEECRIAMINITKRKQAEEALRLAEEAKEAHRLAKEASDAAAKAKSQFFANMSHELRTPMAGILGMLQLALQEDLSPTPRHYLETTLRSAKALIRILNDILDMSKIEAGKLTIEEKPFLLLGCIGESVDIFMPKAQRKELDLVYSVAEEVPKTVVGDRARLLQVLLNLIGNAIKFTEGGKVEIRVAAGGRSPDGKREVIFSVTDSGIGIPEGKKNLLFQAFSQVDVSHSRNYSGTGLGLTICKEIVELMGGTISFESKENMGSTFTFAIPLREASLEGNADSTLDFLTPETTSPVPKGDRIPHLLLAEDDLTIQEVLEQMLTRSNFKLDIAEDGQTVVEMWENGEYDLVLMDVQMPRLDGFEATRAIRKKELERGGYVPIIAMTAHAGNEVEEKCLATGMDAFISKPIDFMKCLQLIRSNIQNKTRGD